MEHRILFLGDQVIRQLIIPCIQLRPIHLVGVLRNELLNCDVFLGLSGLN